MKNPMRKLIDMIRLDEDSRTDKLLGRRTAGSYGRPGSTGQKRLASKGGRRGGQADIEFGLSDIESPEESQADIEFGLSDIESPEESHGDAPYAVIWHGQYRENYGAHNWDGTGEAPQHWKNKGDVGKVLVKNIPDWETAKTLATELNQVDRNEGNEYVQIYAEDVQIVPMSELGKHFHGYDPEMQEYGAKPEQNDARDVIDMANKAVEEDLQEAKKYENNSTEELEKWLNGLAVSNSPNARKTEREIMKELRRRNSKFQESRSKLMRKLIR